MRPGVPERFRSTSAYQAGANERIPGKKLFLPEAIIRIPTEGLIEDGFSFLLLSGVLALFWFHGWRRRGAPDGDGAR